MIFFMFFFIFIFIFVIIIDRLPSWTINANNILDYSRSHQIEVTNLKYITTSSIFVSTSSIFVPTHRIHGMIVRIFIYI